jgi:hypothetical protein
VAPLPVLLLALELVLSQVVVAIVLKAPSLVVQSAVLLVPQLGLPMKIAIAAATTALATERLLPLQI